MSKVDELLIRDVESLVEGQLLVQQRHTTLLADQVNTIPVEVPQGRGDVKAFGFSFRGTQEDAAEIQITFWINGKEVYREVPLMNFITSVNGFGPDFAISAGASRLAKTTYRIPENSTARVEAIAGALGSDSTLTLSAYFTEKFMLSRAPYTFNQGFTILCSAGAVTRFEDVLETQRGRIVGISLTTLSTIADINEPTSGFTIEINGITILENMTPVDFMPSSNRLQTNYWTVNINGGGVWRLLWENQNANDTTIAVVFYFSNRLKSKAPIPIDKQQTVSKHG